MFGSSTGKRIHAGIDGSYNRIRKVFPDAFSKGIMELVEAPVNLACEFNLCVICERFWKL
jgi:hypothetical protein